MVMHECCKGSGVCNISCNDRESEDNLCSDIPLVVCHHPDIRCEYQFLFYGVIKYCGCKRHIKMREEMK